MTLRLYDFLSCKSGLIFGEKKEVMILYVLEIHDLICWVSATTLLIHITCERHHKSRTQQNKKIGRGQSLCRYRHRHTLLVGHKWWLRGIIFVWVYTLFFRKILLVIPLNSFSHGRAQTPCLVPQQSLTSWKISQVVPPILSSGKRVHWYQTSTWFLVCDTLSWGSKIGKMLDQCSLIMKLFIWPSAFAFLWAHSLVCFHVWSLDGDKVQACFYVNVKRVLAHLVKCFSLKALSTHHDWDRWHFFTLHLTTVLQLRWPTDWKCTYCTVCALW